MPGVRYVTEWMICEVVGPRERAPPQESRGRRRAVAVVGRRRDSGRIGSCILILEFGEGGMVMWDE